MAKQIQSLERALFILDSIMFNNEPVTATELSRRLGVHKSTVSHLANTLVEQGYLQRARGAGRLAIGPQVYRAARTTMLSGETLLRFPPVIEELAAGTGETAHLAELRGRSVIYLMNSYPSKALRVQTETGSIEPAHSTAVGKALLSGLYSEELISLYSGVRMERFTDSTITGLDALKEELEEVRRAGYATDRGEQTPGTGCVAAPVRDPRGMVVAAVGISGPAERVFAGDGTVDAVMKAAAAIEQTIREEGDGGER